MWKNYGRIGTPVARSPIVSVPLDPDAPAGELLDAGHLPLPEVERAMRDLARLNRWLLGAGALCRTLLPRLTSGESGRVLDLGTGTGEVAAALVAKARARGCRLRVVGLDRQLTHLRLGRERGTAQLRVVGDATALPFRDGAVCWAFSTLFFHHFDAPTNRRILAEMQRVASRGIAVVDLRRSRWLPAALRLAFPLFGVSRVARHDGEMSARHSWSILEVARLVAGWPVAELRRRFPFRFSLVIDGDHGRR